MNENGLGTLAVSPREVRDEIYSYVVTSLKLSSSRYWGQNRTPLRSFIRISKQLRRESLESFLRNDDSLGLENRNVVIREFLREISPLVDIASHTRAIGFGISSSLLKQYNEHRGDYNLSQSHHPDEFLRIPKGVQKLRSYHYLDGIPLHKLHITMKYTLPYSFASYSYPSSNWQFRLILRSILGTKYPCRRAVKINPDSRSRSLAALDDEHNTMLLDIQKALDVHLEKVKEAEKDGSVDNKWVAREMWLRDRCNQIMPVILLAMRGYHEIIIDQVTEVWQEAEEFDEYFLGDFFALTEAW